MAGLKDVIGKLKQSLAAKAEAPAITPRPAPPRQKPITVEPEPEAFDPSKIPYVEPSERDGWPGDGSGGPKHKMAPGIIEIVVQDYPLISPEAQAVITAAFDEPVRPVKGSKA